MPTSLRQMQMHCFGLVGLVDLVDLVTVDFLAIFLDFILIAASSGGAIDECRLRLERLATGVQLFPV